MIYKTAEDWREAKRKRVLLFGLSGLGKTHVSTLLRASRQWFHYSIDSRIGTRYMGEHIADNFKREAMRVPFLRDLLMTDSVRITSNITFDNLAPLSAYLGKPGDPAKGGLRFDDYMTRQEQHRQAEVASLLDTAHFIDRAFDIYGYEHFVCDSSGSICEVVNPDDPADPVLTALSDTVLMVWIQGSDAHTEELIRRARVSPKPMYYQPDFLHGLWDEYLKENKAEEGDVEPDAFARWAFARALAHRQPLYASMARNWGLTVTADDVAKVRSPADFDALIESALAARG